MNCRALQQTKKIVNNDPLHDVLQEVYNIVQVAEFMAVLNPSRNELADAYLESMFNESRSNDNGSNEVNGLL